MKSKSPRILADNSKMRTAGKREDLQARLVVCADGKGSLAPKWTGLPVHRDTIGLMVAGVLLEGMQGHQADTNYWIINPQLGQSAFLAPQRDERVRAYLLHSKTAAYRFHGAHDLPPFIEELVKSHAPSDWFANARAIGPLATFDGTDTWVEHPYTHGVALVGDAAACTDPSYGQGMSLTLRDVRVLRDALLTHENWDEAGHAYAQAHDHTYRTINTVLGSVLRDWSGSRSPSG